MIRINLLPVRATARQDAVKRELALVGLGLGLVLLICGGLYVGVGAQVSELKAENAQLQKEIDNLKAIVARVDEIDKLQQELRMKLDVIAQLKANKEGPVHMLDELAMATPEKLMLTSLVQGRNDIKLQGVAVSHEVISQFLSTLERSDWFEDVYLLGIDQVEQDGYKLKQFQISAKMVVPKIEKLADAGQEG